MWWTFYICFLLSSIYFHWLQWTEQQLQWPRSNWEQQWLRWCWRAWLWRGRGGGGCWWACPDGLFHKAQAGSCRGRGWGGKSKAVCLHLPPVVQQQTGLHLCYSAPRPAGKPQELSLQVTLLASPAQCVALQQFWMAQSLGSPQDQLFRAATKALCPRET